MNYKKYSLIIILLLILPFINSVNIDVEKQSSPETYIPELNNEIIYELLLTNNGQSDVFSITNLIGLEITPSSGIKIDSGETKKLNLKIKSLEEIDEEGLYIFSYFLKGKKDKEVQEKKLSFDIIPLKKVFSVNADNFNPESNDLDVFIKNNANYNFKDIVINFESSFFDINKEVSLKPYEEKEFSLELEKERFEKLKAGDYTLNAEINIDNKIVKINDTIHFRERDILDISQEDYGFFINTKIISKQNKGNIVSESVTTIKKNIITRLFTSFSPSPDDIERDGGIVTYTWVEKINPGEEFNVTTKTNWLFPFLLIFFIVLVVLLVRQYIRTDLVLRKKISFVKAKGGEFGLKITITASSKAFIEDIKIIDRLPSLVKLHEKFLNEKPDKIDEKKRLIQWKINKLERGEKRVFSYFIYSKVGILGRFALPSAFALYERDGIKRESTSNKAFFLVDQKTKKEE